MKKTLMMIAVAMFSLAAVAQIPDGTGDIPHIAPDQKDVKIAFLTDTHIFHRGEKTDSLLIPAIAEINSSDCHFVLLGGDNVSTGYEKDIRGAYKIYKKIRKPLFGIVGNHEVIRTDNGNTVHKELYGYDRRMVFRAGEYLFVGFDAGPYNRSSAGMVRAEDLEWLEEQFRKARPGEKIICVSHIPLNYEVANHREVTALLRKYGVKAQICGHAHSTLMLNVDSIPCVMGRRFNYVKKGWGAGYNIIEFKDDSIYLYQKRLDHAVPKLFATQKQGFSPELLKRRGRKLQIAPKTYAEAGAVLFKDLRPAVYAPVMVRGGAAYVGHSNGTLYAFDTTTGEERWRYDMGDILCAEPVWHDGKVIYVSPTGLFTALDAATGKVVWTLQAKGAVTGDPVVVGDMLYCSFGVGLFAKINAATGAVVWTARSGSMQMQCVPAVADGKVVVSTWENDVRCYDDKSGKQLWRWFSGDDKFDFAPGLIFPQIVGDRVYVSINYQIVALDLKRGALIWRDEMFRYRKSMGKSSDGTMLFVQSPNSDIIQLRTDMDCFSPKWTATTPKSKKDRNPTLISSVNGVVYKGTMEGMVIAVRESDGVTLWEHKFSDADINNVCGDEQGNVWIQCLDGKLFKIAR
ncbi:MAG: PQQ-binding-like beta-propeller repeat protein [Alistipes sp.]|nr:PQQ-binding-like beta-propeller repeat protein [Alistipes sp.]